MTDSGLMSALDRQKRKLNGRQEAHLIAIACSEHPKDTRTGRSNCLPTRWWRWGLPRASPSRRCAITQKNELKPWKKKEWCIPEVSEFVARMEDVLDLYHADYDPDHPVVCFDETSKQLVADKRPAIGAKPGRVERYDYEYGETALETCSCSVSRKLAGGMSR